ncbi:MAG TPA: HD-GYP domain-containing protein [Clostridiales bacterium]|nr:HD-GYP domain-containing protein [Clostridiales bacterium]
MKKTSIFLLSLTSIISLFMLVDCIYNYAGATVYQLIFWIIIASLCESLPVYFAKNRVVSVTLAVLLALQLSHGTYLTTIVAATSTVFYIIKTEDGEFKHTFNLPFYKTMANFSNFTISTYLSGLLYDFLMDRFNITINNPYMVIVVFLYFAATFLLNTILVSVFLHIMTGSKIIKTWLQNSLWCLPNYAAIAPIGYFLYVLYQNPMGILYILMLMGPLLLARYSFKLYLESKEQYYKIIQTLTAVIEAKDEYTEGHSRRVAYYVEKIAERMRLSPNRIESLKVAALLHDIGKIGIEDSILQKPGKLTNSEWEKIRQHPRIGIRILDEVAFSPVIKDAILHHHEKYTGGGYPDGLDGKRVSLDAFILGIADAYDAITSDRPYRNALSKEQAVSILREERGRQFHPQVADVLIAILEEEKSDVKQDMGTDIKDLVQNKYLQSAEEAAFTMESGENYKKTDW